MEQKAGSFYREKNKEQGRKKKYLIGSGHIVSFGVRRPRVGLAFGDWLTKCIVFLAKGNIYRDMQVKFWFADVVP